MATRVTAAEVIEILDTSLTGTDVLPFVTSANIFVTASLTGKGLSDDNLKEIERWVCAHMVASTKERQSKKEEAGGAKIEYAGYWGQGLSGTSYGQMAITLDPTGTLSSLSVGKQMAYIKAIPQFES